MEKRTDKLIKMPVIRGCIEKWNAGRAEHGSEFQGNPLEELYGEALDALNYCEHAQLEGIDMGTIWGDLLNIANEVQEIWSRTMTPAELTTEEETLS